MLAASTKCCNSYGFLGWSTILPAVPDDASKITTLILLMHWCLGPFYGAIAVPSVTRCRRCCSGHQCTGGVRQWRHVTVVTPGEWQNVKLGRAAAHSVRMGPTFFKCFLFTKMARREKIIICTLYFIIRPYCLQNI